MSSEETPSEETSPGNTKRTAVLVVHGMGNQRPLETMRGVFEAVWVKNAAVKGKHAGRDGRDKLYWMHPDRLTREVDLSVLTTDYISDEEKRRFDFHELYWAHHMSGTPAFAVLLWLFALVRRGPGGRWLSLKVTWWLAAPFLAMVCAAGIFLLLTVVKAIAPEGGFADLISIFTFSLTVSIAIGVFLTAINRANLGLYIIGFGIFVSLVGLVYFGGSQQTEPIDFAKSTTMLIVPILALIFSIVVMHVPGFIVASLGFMIWYVFWLLAWRNVGCLSPWTGPVGILFPDDATCLDFWLRAGPWSLGSVDMVWGAFTVIAIYVLLNAFFLQTVLGDAARYFRNTPSNVAVRRAIRRHALDALEGLHRDERYDRVIVVAHSLGTVVAYDMLRAYWSRVNRRIAISNDVAATANTLQEIIDGPMKAAWKDRPREERWAAREPMPADADRLRQDFYAAQNNLMRAIWCAYDVNARSAWRAVLDDKAAPLETSSPPTWKVTDFITLGSPLTHGAYLLADADTREHALKEFEQRKEERTFPSATARLERFPINLAHTPLH